jgi:APA family basic amino acid/polyamine antiporter
MADSPGSGHPGDRLRRELTLPDATFLLIASVVGAGIFFTPGRVADLLPHPGWMLLAWLVGAFLSLAGALANAELSSMFPRAGGDYVYLREAFQPVAGFLVGWLTFFAIYTGTIAALAAAFGDSIAARFDLGEGATIPIAVAITVVVSVINYVGVKWGAIANNLTSALKVLALVAFAALGPLSGAGSAEHFVPAASAAPSGTTLTAFGLAMSPILFTFLGWNAIVYVASEVRDPARTVPRSLFVGLAVCTAIYVALNAVYVYALPMSELRGVPDAAQASARVLFGPVGGTVLGLFVVISILGTLNATVLVGPRIAYAMSLDGLFFRGADRVSPRFGTPSVALALQCGVAVVLLLVLGSFPSALDFTTFAILLATASDVLALYWLRRTQAGRSRPYRAWGYPVVPGLYLGVTLLIAGVMLMSRPLECLISVGMLASGLPFYWAFRRQNPV